MAFVITEPCVGTCDTACVEVCPVDCIPRDPAHEENAIQLMAIMEHPYYASFGYHISSELREGADLILLRRHADMRLVDPQAVFQGRLSLFKAIG